MTDTGVRACGRAPACARERGDVCGCCFCSGEAEEGEGVGVNAEESEGEGEEEGEGEMVREGGRRRNKVPDRGEGVCVEVEEEEGGDEEAKMRAGEEEEEEEERGGGGEGTAKANGGWTEMGMAAGGGGACVLTRGRCTCDAVVHMTGWPPDMTTCAGTAIMAPACGTRLKACDEKRLEVARGGTEEGSSTDDGCTCTRAGQGVPEEESMKVGVYV